MFGGGAGHIADMIARIKQNRALLKIKRYFKQHPRAGDIDFTKHTAHNHTYKKTTKGQLRKIREDAKDEQRKIVRKRVVVFFVSLLITVLYHPLHL